LNIGHNPTSAEPCIAGYQTGLQDGRGEILRYAICCLVFQSVVVMLVVQTKKIGASAAFLATLGSFISGVDQIIQDPGLC
jgi:hypothetical protein